MRDLFRFELNNIAKQIRQEKPRRKAPDLVPAYKVQRLSRKARYLHLAYCCLLRARPKDVPLEGSLDQEIILDKYKKVEQNASEDVDWVKVQRIYDELLGKIEEKSSTAVYVFVDPDMRKEQYPVQVGHTIAELVQCHSDLPEMAHWVDVDKDLIVLALNNDHPQYFRYLSRIKEEYCWASFYDNDEYTTTYACGPICRKKAKMLFGELDLL